MRTLKIFLVLSVIFAVGCSTMIKEGRMIDRAKLDEVMPGTTNAEQMKSILGNPESTGKGKAGEDIYYYRFYQYTPTPWYKLDKQANQKVQITVVNGVVQKYGVVDNMISNIKD